MNNIVTFYQGNGYLFRDMCYTCTADVYANSNYYEFK